MKNQNNSRQGKLIKTGKYRDIIKLYELGFSINKIANNCLISRSTVRKYIQVTLDNGINYEDINSFSDKKIISFILKNKKKSQISLDFEKIYTQLKNDKLNIIQLWKDGFENKKWKYSYSYFCRLYNQWLIENEKAPQNHKIYRQKHKIWMHKLSQGKIRASQMKLNFSKEIKMSDIQELSDNLFTKKIRYRNRAISIISYLNNIPESIVARFLFSKTKTIKRYIQQYNEGGVKNLFDFSKKGKIKSQDSVYIDKLFSIMHSPPIDFNINRTSWRLEDLKQIMATFELDISIANIRKIIKDSGYSFRKAKKVLTSTDPEYREKLEAITKILSNLGPKDKFFSIDEYGPFAIKIQGGKMLMPPGEMYTVPQHQKSKGSLIITAALELSTNQITHFYSDKKNTEEMIKLLDVLLEKYSDEECIYLSWDAASWHASQALYEKVEKVNSKEYKCEYKSPIVRLAPLPACAQFLNIIESIFSGMSRAIIHNSDYESVDKAKSAIDLYFQERNQHFMENPKRAGNKIWGKERVLVEFCESNNCKDPNYR